MVFSDIMWMDMGVSKDCGGGKVEKGQEDGVIIMNYILDQVSLISVSTMYLERNPYIRNSGAQISTPILYSFPPLPLAPLISHSRLPAFQFPSTLHLGYLDNS